VTYNYSTFNDLLISANTTTGGLYGAILPFVIFLIVYGYTSIWGFKKAFATASFLSFLFAAPLFALGILSGWIFTILLVLTLIGVFLNVR